MTELSSAAQAVLDAFASAPINSRSGSRLALAAVLRAAADQAVPFEPLHGVDERWILERNTRQICRRKLLAIAAELQN